MVPTASNILTFAAGEDTLDISGLPNGEITVFSSSQIGDSRLTLGIDYTITAKEVSILSDQYDNIITVVSLPSLSFDLPKVGPPSGADLGAAIEAFKQHSCWLQSQIDRAYLDPIGGSDSERRFSLGSIISDLVDRVERSEASLIGRIENTEISLAASINSIKSELEEQEAKAVSVPAVPKESKWSFDPVDCPFKGAILEPMREYAIWVEAHHLEKMGGAKLSRKLSPARLLGHVPSGRSWIDDLICVPSDEKFIFRAKLETA